MIFALSMSCLPLARCTAWNDAGHHIINLAAWEKLDDAERDSLLALLEDHPWYARHFVGAMPNAVWQLPEAGKRQWIFAHAGHWPDLVRGGSLLVTDRESTQFNRPTWHFLDLPLFLNERDAQEMRASLVINDASDRPPTIDEDRLNAVQAIQLVLDRLKNDKLPRGDRAIALCWLTHLVADIHQPCHSTALYSKGLYPEGDRGASAILTVHRDNLHALWDKALLNRTDFATEQAKAKRLAAFGGPSLSIPSKPLQGNAMDWLYEGHDLAKQFVYTPEVLDALRRWEADLKDGEVTLSVEYRQAMRRTANERAAVATARLTTLLREAIPTIQPR
jgi:hypothetical protein